MEYEYEYGFSVRLKETLPEELESWLAALATGTMPEGFPSSGANPDEVSDEEVFRLLTLVDRGGFARAVSFRPGGDWGKPCLQVWGAATSEAFFMPFPALAEWLAQWVDEVGCGGYYHRRSLCHPTIVYFAQGKPYMLQVTGTPSGLIDGEPFPTELVGAGGGREGSYEEEKEDRTF